MLGEYQVVAKVVRQQGSCDAGHGVGDEFAIGRTTPSGMCSWAFHAVFPFAAVLRLGGSFFWQDDPDTIAVACPDAANPVVFEVRRIGPV